MAQHYKNCKKIMTQDEVKKVAEQMINEKIENASKAITKFEHLRDMYVELRKKGFHDGANAIKNAIFFYLMINPNATEAEVAKMLIEKLNINNN